MTAVLPDCFCVLMITVSDANGNPLTYGNLVTVVKELKIKGMVDTQQNQHKFAAPWIAKFANPANNLYICRLFFG